MLRPAGDVVCIGLPHSVWSVRLRRITSATMSSEVRGSTHMVDDRPYPPGRVRRWWWASSQGQRLAAAGSATVIGLAVVGVALVNLEIAPASKNGSPAPALSLPGSSSSVVTVTGSGTAPGSGTSTGAGSSQAGATTSSGGPSLNVPGGTPVQAGAGGAGLPSTTRPTPVTTTAPMTTAASTTHPPTSTSPPQGGVQQGVRIGQQCAPEGAQGITAQGQPAVCRPGGPGPGRRDEWKKG